MKNISKKIISLLTAVIVLITLSFPLTASAASAKSFNDTYDYFTDQYRNLTDKNHVLKTAEYYQFYNYFLGGTDLAAYYGGTANATVQPSSGKYVFLLGGVWSQATQTAIGYVNDVAKEYGVTAIYNFDPKLDGDSLDISADPVYAAKYNAILTKLGVSQLQFPSVVVYEKDSVTTGHVVSSYSWTDTSFSGQSAIDAFKTALRTNAFDPAANSGKISNIKVSDSDYFRSVLNARYYNSFKATDFKAALRPLPENKDNLFEVVTLSELKGVLGSKGNYAVLFGGLWCHNTWAVVNLVEKYAEEYNISKIYFYDTVLDSAGSSVSSTDQLQTRSTTYKPGGTGTADAASPIAHLYVDLVNQYIPNVYTLNQGEADGAKAAGTDAPASKFISYTNGSNTVSARRIQLPDFIVYNKDHKDAQGNAAPVIGNVEIMTELWRTDSTATGTGDDAYNAGGVYDQYTVGYNRTVNDSYTYWAPGLNQVLGEFTGSQLGDLIDKAKSLNAADYTAASYSAVTTALNTANSVKASIDAAVNAKSANTTAPEGFVIENAYTSLTQALNGLVAVNPASSATSSGQSSSETTGTAENPKTGETDSPIIVSELAAIAALGVGTALILLKKKSSVK